MSIHPRPIHMQTECKFSHLNRSTKLFIGWYRIRVPNVFVRKLQEKKTPDDNYDPNMVKLMEMMLIDSGSHMTINHNANLSATRPQSHKSRDQSVATMREN